MLCICLPPQEHSQLADSVAGMRSASLALAAAVAAEGPLALDGAAATPAHPSMLPASLPAPIAGTSLQLGAPAAGASLPNMLRSLRPLAGERTAAKIGACMFWSACLGWWWKWVVSRNGCIQYWTAAQRCRQNGAILISPALPFLLHCCSLLPAAGLLLRR